jgi:hypothetical protein
MFHGEIVNPQILTTLDTQYTGSRQENRHNKENYKDDQQGRQKKRERTLAWCL